MRRKEWVQHIIRLFQETMPEPQSELHYENPFQLLIAVMLSAQCTDRRINQITPTLFAQYPTPQAMANATEDELFPYIKTISYPNNKAKYLVGIARKLMNEFQGEVPSSGELLESLPGVGRKTANVIQAIIFQKSRMAVDTHVFRVSHRMAIVPKRCTTPLSVEKELTKLFPAELIPMAHHWLLLHGRYTCLARKPLCDTCIFASLCPKRLQ